MSQRRAIQASNPAYDAVAAYSDEHNLTLKEALDAIVLQGPVDSGGAELVYEERLVPEAEIASGPRQGRPATKADVAELLEAINAEAEQTRQHVSGQHGLTRFQGMVGRGQLAGVLGGPEVQRAQYRAEIDALQGRLSPELAEVAEVMRGELERSYEGGTGYALEDGE